MPDVAKRKWYELDSLVPYRDLILALGFGLFVGGVMMFSVSVGVIVFGAGLVWVSQRMAQ